MTAATATERLFLPRGWTHHVLQLAIWIGFLAAYQVARGMAERNPGEAFDNGLKVVDIERRASGLWELSLQSYAHRSDVVTCSVPEGRAMMDAGKVRALAAMARERNPQFASVPTLKEGLGVDFSLGSWRGIAGPKGLPQPITDKLAAALKKVQESKDFRDFMNARGFALVWQDAAGFTKFMDDDNARMGALLKSAGLAKT